MIYPVRNRSRWLPLCVLGGLLVSVAVAGCGSNGYSPSCPPLPLYNVSKSSNKASVVAARHASELAGCSTGKGDASSGSASGGNSGTTPVDAGGG